MSEEQTPAERIRAQAREATRFALLQAGLEGTIESGGEFPTLDEVCSRAGYTRGAFYGYFEGREDFIRELLDWVLNDIIASLFESTTEGDADLPEIVRRFAGTLDAGELPDIERNVRVGYLAVLREAQSGSPIRAKHAELMTGIAERLEERVQAAQKAGTIRKDVDAADLAMLLLLTAIGAVSWFGLGILSGQERISETLLGLLEAE